MATWDITQGTKLQIESYDAASHVACRLDATHVLDVYSNGYGAAYAETFEIDPSDRSISSAYTRLSLYSGADAGNHNGVFLLNSTHAIVAGKNADDKGFIQVLAINTSTWQVTKVGTPYVTSGTIADSPIKIKELDSTHFLVGWGSAGYADGYVAWQVFQVNTGTWAVTEAGDPTGTPISPGFHDFLVASSSRVILFYGSTVYMMSINQSTWGLSGTSGDAISNPCNNNHHAVWPVDSTHVIDFGNVGAQVFSFDTGDGDIEAVGTKWQHGYANYYNSAWEIVPYDNKFIRFGENNNKGKGIAQTFDVDDSTYTVTELGDELEFVSGDAEYNSCAYMSAGVYVDFHGGSKGYATVFTVEIDVEPTVVTQAASNISNNSITGNGQISDLADGGTINRRGFCYKEGTSGDPETSDSVAYDDGSFGTGNFSKSITGLSGATSYRVRAYATNDYVTGYGDTVQVLTAPDAPTDVTASDETYTDKVRITWTASPGATGYRVYRGDTALEWLGDVEVYDDEGADAGTVYGGVAVATEGTHTDKVVVYVENVATYPGSYHTYKVKARNTSGEGPLSTGDSGRRGIGAVSYQWQRSEGDSDDNYSDIVGETSATLEDTEAPE